MVDHAWVQENLDTYLAGDLTTSERDRVERHAALCESCGNALAEARRLEQMMNSVFADARPDTNLEERLVQSLRAVPVRSAQRPMFWRVAVSAAAVLVIGLIGAAVQGIAGGDLFGSAESHQSLREARVGTDLVGGTVFGYEKEGRRATTYYDRQGKQSSVDGDPAMEKKYKPKLDALRTYDIDPATVQPDTEIRYKGERIEDVTVPGEMKPNEAVGIRDGEKKAIPMNLPAPGGGFGQGGALETLTKGKNKEAGYELPPARQPVPLQDVFKFKADVKNLDVAKMQEYYKEGAESLDKLTKNLEDKGGGGKDKESEKKDPPKTEGRPPVELPMTVVTVKPTSEDALKSKLFAMGPPLPSPSVSPSVPAPRTGPAYFDQPGKPPGPVPPAGFPINPPGGTKGIPGPGKGGDQLGQDKGDGKDNGEKKEGDNEKVPDGTKPGQKPEPKDEPKAAPKKFPEPPLETNRKIIRTGDMEFEVPKYKTAIDDIRDLVLGVKIDGKVLIEPIPNAFIGAENSDTLPNGKTRGSIIVRMPPQYLDAFIRDLDRKLSQSGTLKSKRIVSLDVTKQYTDIESRLRAARAIEERLIQIIKTPKSEIKDLLAAEKELGLWRTKIEEMEGEIRYYGNQVSLSTLTITLFEKEILAATAVVITENVRMRLEVDDVAKSHKIVMDAIEDPKILGRITKSELKQHVAGQLQSIIHAEIPPNKKIAFTVILQGLGITSLHEENQGQYSEGGTGRGSKLQRREDDVRFEISQYNTANVKPRLSADLKIATDDVPSAYDKLIKAINDPKVKGQIRDAKLDEKDKLNKTATIDFNVPTAARKEIDDLLKSFGPELERFTIRAQVSELSTDRKFGYTVVLRDFAAIPPSKAIVDTIGATDVPDSYSKLIAAIMDANGQLADSNLNELNKLDIVAKLEFTVPTDKKKIIDDLLLTIGTSMARNNVTPPMSHLTTNRKFGYVLFLRDVNTIQSSKSSDLKVSVLDVPAAYVKLTEAIGGAKGYIASTVLNDQDKLRTSAQISFSVPIGQKSNMDALLSGLGDVLKRFNAPQAPANQLSSDKKFSYTVELLDANTVQASKASKWTVAVNDVPTNYAKLTKAIAAAKGHISDSALNEQDKLDINAQISFSVPLAEKVNMDKLLDELGDLLSRNELKAHPNQSLSDKKIGYFVELRDLITIEPSQRSKVSVAGANVPANYAKLLKEIAEVKGQLGAATLSDKDKLNISAQVTFIIPSEHKAKFKALLEEMGTILSSDDTQASDKKQTTKRKFGYEVDLRDFANIPARETFTWQVTLLDVQGTYRDLKDAVTRAKGWVSHAKLDQDKKAEFYFDVPAGEKAAIDQLLTKSGALTARTSSEVAVNTLATDKKVGYQVVLTSVATTEPRERVKLTFETEDVDAKSTQFTQIVTAGKGKLIDSGIERKENGQAIAILVFDVPYASQKTLIQQMGKPTTQKATSDEKVPLNDLTTARLIVTLNSAGSIIDPGSGVGAYVRKSLYLSFNILAIIGMSIIVGLSAIVPCILLIWVGFKAYALFTSGEGHSMTPTLATAAGPQPTADEDKPAEPHSGESTPKA